MRTMTRKEYDALPIYSNLSEAPDLVEIRLNFAPGHGLYKGVIFVKNIGGIDATRVDIIDE